MLLRLVPTLFYDTLAPALDLFVDGLGFACIHRDAEMAVVMRDGVKAILTVDPALAATDRPEIALETDTIEAMNAEVTGRRPDLLHPNLRTVTERPWGAREFAVLDRTGVCVVFRQWPAVSGVRASPWRRPRSRASSPWPRSAGAPAARGRRARSRPAR